MTEADIHSPSSREQALRNILPEDAKQHQPLLQEIFRREMEYRKSEGDQAYFENLYWGAPICCSMLRTCATSSRCGLPSI